MWSKNVSIYNVCQNVVKNTLGWVWLKNLKKSGSKSTIILQLRHLPLDDAVDSNDPARFALKKIFLGLEAVAAAAALDPADALTFSVPPPTAATAAALFIATVPVRP